MAKEKAVVLCSGGLNSAVATAIAMRDFAAALLHVQLGHRASAKEAELFDQQADFFAARERLVVEMPHFAVMGGNARVSRKRAIEDALAIGEGPSNCYMPGLINTLVSAAFTWASDIGATRIVLGISENLGPPAPRTCEIYPDYSREFLHLCNHLLGEVSRGRPVSIVTPLIDLNRGEIIRLGRRLGTPLEITWSCLSSASEPCGACLGCATRQRGFLDAAMPDPLVLEPAGRR